jgi:hypothetical protein
MGNFVPAQPRNKQPSKQQQLTTLAPNASLGQLGKDALAMLRVPHVATSQTPIDFRANNNPLPLQRLK